jgi:pheromone shutdown protein TraB
VVGVVVALGVAWIAVALPVVLLLGLLAGLVAIRRRLWPRPDDPTD